MKYEIRMGLPEMKALWDRLKEKHQSGEISKKDEQLYQKWGKTMKLLSQNPYYPSLKTHDIEALTRRYGSHILKIKPAEPCAHTGYMDRGGRR